MKVYVVEPDTYPEDRYIWGIFSSEEKAREAIERYQHVAGGSYLQDDFEIIEYVIDNIDEIWGDRIYVFDRKGRYKEKRFYIVYEKFDDYVEKDYCGDYEVHICVDSYDDDKFGDAWKLLEKYLGDDKND